MNRMVAAGSIARRFLHPQHLAHAVETACKFLRDIYARGSEEFGERTVRADEIDDEGAAQILIDAFVCQKIADIEEVARVLAVQGGDNLSGIEVSK
jgi:hypothetical protein